MLDVILHPKYTSPDLLFMKNFFGKIIIALVGRVGGKSKAQADSPTFKSKT